MDRPIVTLTVNPALDLSASVEVLRPFSKLRCSGERRDAGGGGINVARVAARFGAKPLAVFPAGGPIGSYLAELVATEGIASAMVPIAGNTREDVTVNETESGRQYRFVLSGPKMSLEEEERLLTVFGARLVPDALAVASGSLPPGMADDFYARVAQIANAKGARLALDSSGPPLANALAAGVMLIKPNLRELQGLARTPLPDRASRLAAARGLVQSGRVELVALSLAEEGALLVGRDIALAASAPKIVPVSTVGAGDSFLGALAAMLAKESDLKTAFRMAVAAGSAALLAPGTELCAAAKAKELFEQVSIEEL